MPLLSRLFIKSSLIYMALGMALGAVLLSEKGLGFQPDLWRLLPAHIQLMLVGWLAQFAMGVGYWMFPRFGGGAHRGRRWPAGLAYGCTNFGLLTALFAYMLDWAGAREPFLLVLSGGLEAVGALAYALHAWPRIKPLESIFGPKSR